MANMQTECLNVKCSNKVKDGAKWCGMECKKQFLLNNYSPDATIRAMKESQEDFREGQRRVLKEIKDSGLSVSEYILSIGEFKHSQTLEKEKGQ